MTLNLSERYRGLMLRAPDGPVGGGSSPSPSAPASAPSGASSAASPSSTPSENSGTSSPAPSTPSPASSPGAAGSGGAGEAFDFGAMFEAPSDSVAALAATEAPAAAPASPPQQQEAQIEAAAPPAEAPPATAETQAAAAAPAAPGQSTPPAEAQPPQIDPYDPAMLAQQLSQIEPQAVQMVADQMFRLTDEEKEALEQDVIGTVPKLLAKVFVKSQQNVLQQLGRMIPVMMQRHLASVDRNRGNEDKFYSRWPDIKRDQHHNSVMRYAAVYRQMHPTATLDQMVEDLGPMIMMAHKIVPQTAGSAAKGQPARPAPQGGANGRSPPASPFVPAGAGPTSVQQRAPEMEAWEAMFRQE